MINRAELKLNAKAQIKGNIGVLFVILLLISLISGALNYIPIAGALVSSLVVLPAFTLSIAYVYVKLVAGTKPEIADTFYGFKDLWAAFKLNFFVGLFTFLWSLLLIIPGIIKALSYSMAHYILAENPGMAAFEAINRSKAMMDGHKADLFVLMLSFIGWSLLGAITFGIAYIWIIPYMSATYVNFYNTIKGEQASVAPASEAVEAVVEE